MNKILLILLLVFITDKIFAQQQLLSPDKSIRISIAAGKQLAWIAFVDEKIIVNNTLIDMKLDNGISLSGNLKIRSVKTKSVNENIVAQIPVSRFITLKISRVQNQSTKFSRVSI